MPLSGPELAEPIDVRNLLSAGLETKPDALALVSATTRWTWRELDRATSRYALNLLGLGLEPGERVASLMPNRASLLVHYLGCIKAGLVSTPLNYRYMPPEIDHALEVSGASLLVSHAERDEDVSSSERVGGLRLGVIRYGDPKGDGRSFEALLEGESSGSLPELGSDAAVFIFFTSGSTGKPKGVTHTYETLGWLLGSAAAACEMTPSDVALPGSSMSHMGAFMFSSATLATGGRVVVARTFDGDELLPLLREHRPTMLFMLPAALIAMVRDHGATAEDFTSLRLCRSGGDKVSAELEREFTDLAGFPIDEGYGMTEIGLATLNPPSGVIKIGSVGRPIPGFTMSIRDDDGAEVPAGADGGLWVRTRSRTVGYWNDPRVTAEAIVDGWMNTGDVMRADEEGYLWFRGRKKQIIVHDASNICPQEVEEALQEHESVELAGVVGIHDLVHGENVRAYVSLREGSSRPKMQELIRFARDRVGYKAPEHVVVLDEMPLNATGKVDRVTLKAMAERDHHPD